MSSFDIKKVPSQKGRIAIVTGANIGLGYETALALVQKEMKVILACRNLEKANNAKKEILAKVPAADLDIIQLDLGSLESVRGFASSFLAKYDQLDLLINNAGIMVPPFSLTTDGFESQLGVNYLAHFLLTGLLLDVITKTPNSRIVSLSSNAHKRGKINFDDLQSKQKYSALAAYCQSKVACLIFAYELQRRLDKIDCSTISVAAHPGVSDTNLAQYVSKIMMAILGPILRLTMIQSAKAGAEPTLYAALGEDVKGGDYFGPSGWQEFKGRAKKVDSTAHSKDTTVAERLWAVSEELTAIKFLS